MNDKLREMEKEFRRTVITGISRIEHTQEETSKEVNQLKSRVELHIQQSNFSGDSIKKSLDEYNYQLKKHIEGVQQNRARIELLEKTKEAKDKRAALITKLIIGLVPLVATVFGLYTTNTN